MADSPSHKFGQDLGNLLEELVLDNILKPRLLEFTVQGRFYLDWQKSRPARATKKVSWHDKYGNKHDLDFVIEEGGTEQTLGRPVAFIESAWRRYTKHSKNKAQEIQGAILPLVEHYHHCAPFHGVVLAGDFTEPSLEQLRNNGFTVLYITYNSVVASFERIGFDIAFDEDTPDAIYAAANVRLAALTIEDRAMILSALQAASEDDTNAFMSALRSVLERNIVNVFIIPLFGNRHEFASLQDALLGIEAMDVATPAGAFVKVEILIRYNNGDAVNASFHDLRSVADFIRRMA